MTYNGSGTATITTVFGGVNEITNGLFGIFILVMTFGIVYYFSRNQPVREAMVAASFVTMIVSIFGALLGFVQDEHVGMTIVVFIGSLAMLINRK
jgi:hypothetical protein